MDDVTDVVFREIVADLARPDVFFTEFVNADGLLYNPKRVSRKLRLTEIQRPVVAQIWGIHPENIAKAAKTVKDLGFDGIDLNMGCPDRKVVKQGGGAGMIGNYELVKEVIDAARVGLPLSAKTRLGININIAKEWLGFLLEQKLAALTVHGRLAKQMSNGQADWEEIGKAVKLREKISPETLIIGNGDVKFYSEVLEKYERYGIDGVMIGRGIFANPLVFSKTERELNREEKIALAKKHFELFRQIWGQDKNFEIVKKFFKIYINNFPDAAMLRKKLMEAKTPEEIGRIFVANEGLEPPTSSM